MGVLSFDARAAISGSNVAVNTFHVLCGTQPSAAEVNSLMTPFKVFYDSWVAYRETGKSHTIGSRVLYFQEAWWTKPTFDVNGKLLTKGKFNTEPIIIGNTTISSAVGSGGVSVPPQLASVVSWRTAISGRSGRGRSYLGVLGSTSMASNIINGSFVGVVNTSANTLISAVAALTPASGAMKLGIWSPTKGVIREVLSGTMDATFDTMRSRVK